MSGMKEWVGKARVPPRGMQKRKETRRGPPKPQRSPAPGVHPAHPQHQWHWWHPVALGQGFLKSHRPQERRGEPGGPAAVAGRSRTSPLSMTFHVRNDPMACHLSNPGGCHAFWGPLPWEACPQVSDHPPRSLASFWPRVPLVVGSKSSPPPPRTLHFVTFWIMSLFLLGIVIGYVSHVHCLHGK